MGLKTDERSALQVWQDAEEERERTVGQYVELGELVDVEFELADRAAEKGPSYRPPVPVRFEEAA